MSAVDFLGELAIAIQQGKAQGEAYAAQERSRSTGDGNYDSGRVGNPDCPANAQYIAGRTSETISDLQDMVARNDRTCGSCVGPDGSLGYYCE